MKKNPQEYIGSLLFRFDLEFRIGRYRLMAPAPGYFVAEVLDKYREENFLVHTRKQRQKANTFDQTVADVPALQPLSKEEYAALPGLSEEQIQAALERGRREAKLFCDKYGTPQSRDRRYW